MLGMLVQIFLSNDSTDHEGTGFLVDDSESGSSGMRIMA